RSTIEPGVVKYAGGVEDASKIGFFFTSRRRHTRWPRDWSSDVCSSDLYYVAVAADRIYANPGTLTGSIGVIMQMANFEQLMKKVGVDYVVVKAGAFKDVGNPGRSMTPEERRVLQALLDDVHGQFIGAVAEGRKLDRAQV